jgi:hypothetical protein
MSAFGRHVLAPPHDDGDKDDEKDACDNADGSWIHEKFSLELCEKSVVRKNTG